jgi:hypothetical protein
MNFRTPLLAALAALAACSPPSEDNRTTTEPAPESTTATTEPATPAHGEATRKQAAGSAPPAAEVTRPLEIGSRLELFVDDFLIERMEGLRFELHEPVPRGIVLEGIEEPYEGFGSMGVMVWQDGDTFRMFYRALNAAGTDQWLPEWAIAESTDGIHWTRPRVNARLLPSQRMNNFIANPEGGRIPQLLGIALNTRPSAPPEQRYIGIEPSMLDNYHYKAFVWVSPDGFRWTRLSEEPLYESKLFNSFDSLPMLFWSEAGGQYVLYYRYTIEGEMAGADNLPGYRSVARTTSPDLRTWSEPEKMAYDEPGSLRPTENFYTNATRPYFRAPHIYTAFPARHIPGVRVITDDQIRDTKLGTWREYRYDVDIADTAFMTTRVEHPTLYKRTVKDTFIRPGPDPANWTSRNNYALAGVLQTGPAEMSLFVNRRQNQLDWRIERLTLRLDGFMSLHAPYEGGEMLTKPLVFSGRHLILNHANSAPGIIRVEIQDADGTPLPGFTLDECDPINGDAIAREVTWRRGDGDVGGLAGRPVRLRFVMNDADLYALQFVEAKPTPAAYVDEPPVVISAVPALDAPDGELTVEAFLYFDPPYEHPITSRVLSKYNHAPGGSGSPDDSRRGWEINTRHDGKLEFRVRQQGASDQTLATDRKIPLREWFHVACVYDRPNERMRIFLDGKPAGEMAIPDLPVNPTPDQDLVLGRYGNTRSIIHDFHGRIDELRISNTARTFDAPPSRPFDGSEPGTIALYHFDERTDDGTTPNSAAEPAAEPATGISADGTRRLVDSLPGFGSALGF